MLSKMVATGCRWLLKTNQCEIQLWIQLLSHTEKRHFRYSVATGDYGSHLGCWRTRHWISAAVSKILAACQMGQSDGTPVSWTAPSMELFLLHDFRSMAATCAITCMDISLLSALPARMQDQEAGAPTLSPVCLARILFWNWPCSQDSKCSRRRHKNGFSLPSEVKTSV